MPETPMNWVSSITRFFMDRRSLAIILFIALVTGGLFAASNLRREGFPKVPVKIVVVSTVYKGAAAGEVESSVTNPLESVIRDVSEVKSVSSNTVESHSTVIATLNEDANLDAGLQNITSKVSSVTLPADADKPTVSQPTTGSSSFVFGLTGPTDYETLLAQGRIFEREVQQVKGIKQVELASKVTDKISVVFDPVKLAAAGVDTTQLSAAINANNLNLPAGADLTIDGSRATVLLAARDQGVDDLGATPLPTLRGGTVKLSDVATIRSAADQAGTINRIGVSDHTLPSAEPGLVYNVDIRPDADILAVNKRLGDTLDRLKSSGTLRKDVQLTRLFDDAASTSHQINEIKAGAVGEKWEGIGNIGYAGYLLGGIWLLMLAMFLFVNFRTAIIAGIAIPLSFLLTLLALYLTHHTLNTLTLFSMILVLGLVVDPAIVVLESIQRFKDLGFSAREAVLKGVSSIGQGLVMATLCSIIVFTPFGIVSGIFGELIKLIPITVIPALIASFFVPLIFLAPLAGRFMKGRHHAGPVDDPDLALWRVSRWFKTTNMFILRHLPLQILIMLVAIIAPVALTAYLFTSGHVQSAQFSKPHDTTEALVSVAYPASFTAAQIDDLGHKTEAVLANHYEIKSYYYMVQSPTGFTVYLSLIPVNERTVTSEELVKKIKNELPQDAGKQVYSRASTLSYGPPEQEFPVQIQIYESDLAKLKAFTLKVADHAKHMDGVTRVSDGYTDGSTTSVRVSVDKAAAANRGLNAVAVGGQIAGLLGGQTLTKLSLEQGSVDVVGSFQGADKYTSIDELKKLPIATATGPIQLGQIATLAQDSPAGVISHQNGLRFGTVRATVAAGTESFAVQKDLNNWAKSQVAAAGLKSNALESKGENDDITASFINLFEALGVAIIMIYLVLALFFRSFLKPLIITFALPLSFLGVFPILAALKNQFGLLEIIGLITLAGIVVNVGIFVIDYANRKVASGASAKEAIAEATAVRFRPIFLTKITALGSLLPLALLSPFWRGLSSVIIAGILTSGILSLFTTPILYVWFTKLSELPGNISRRRHQAKPAPAPAISADSKQPARP